MCVRETQTLFRKTVQVRRVNGRSAVALRGDVTQIVCINQHDIWFIGCGGRARCSEKRDYKRNCKEGIAPTELLNRHSLCPVNSRISFTSSSRYGFPSV